MSHVGQNDVQGLGQQVSNCIMSLKLYITLNFYFQIFNIKKVPVKKLFLFKFDTSLICN